MVGYDYIRAAREDALTLHFQWLYKASCGGNVTGKMNLSGSFTRLLRDSGQRSVPARSGLSIKSCGWAVKNSERVFYRDRILAFFEK